MVEFLFVCLFRQNVAIMCSLRVAISAIEGGFLAISFYCCILCSIKNMTWMMWLWGHVAVSSATCTENSSLLCTWAWCESCATRYTPLSSAERLQTPDEVQPQEKTMETIDKVLVHVCKNLFCWAPKKVAVAARFVRACVRTGAQPAAEAFVVVTEARRVSAFHQRRRKYKRH